jgi:hypothetical protein
MGRMSYAHNDHYKWIESNYGVKCSDLGKEVANILGFVGGGIYNAPIRTEKIDWTDDYCIEVNWEGSLPNYDFSRLTYLVIECFERMIRVSIEPCNFRNLKLRFWRRKTRDLNAGLSERLPTLQHMINVQNELYGRTEE